VPQIEVTFDIDANGIVHVSAKDLGTGKEQSMTITGGSGLSKEEVERMMKDAESHAEEDKARREEADVRNGAEGLVYQTEKFLKDNAEKIPAEGKANVEEPLATLKKALEGTDIPSIKTAMEALAEASQAVGAAMYQEQAANAEASNENATNNGEDIVDAEIVDEGVKISDKRRIDPQTGQPRDESAANQNSGETSAETPDKVSELTADLQRITAEYSNYRKRVDRDRELIRDMSTSVALEQLIPILDDISRAREHGDLTGTFSTVADALSTVTKRLGLVEFGKVDEDFDPSIHEALSTMEDDSVQSQKVGTVAQVGYKVGERILRPARVVVKQPPAK
jgi:molecular chaperone GrpE (heat shock protein)